jgi:Uma2 family endonuclease
MSTILPDSPPTQWTLADVQAHLPGLPPNRIRSYPSPGTATEADVLEAEARSGRICELIDGTLVEKATTSLESRLAAELIYFIRRYLEVNDLGTLLAGDGYLTILPAQIRAPDVSFIRWERFAGRKPPKAAIYAVAPDLAVEILSEGNTPEEMDRKLREYFLAGVRLVWHIEPKTRNARAYTAEDAGTEVGSNDSLAGGDVLPGFTLSLAQLFARVDGPRQE